MAKKIQGKTIAEWREEAVAAFTKVPKSSVAFDYAKIPKEVRILLLQDVEYNETTKQVLASQYVKDLIKLNEVLDGNYGVETRDPSGTILKALGMKQDILYRSLGVEADESNALNITFTSYTRKEMELIDTVVVKQPRNNADISTILDNIDEEHGDN